MKRPGGVALGLVLAFLAYASWGLLSPVGKHLLGELPPLWLNAVRFLLATALLVAFLGPRATHASLAACRNRTLLVANLLANASLTLFLFALARPGILPTYATLGFYTAPLWTALLAHFALRERVGPWFAPAGALLMAGGYLALMGGLRPPPGFDMVGMALAIASGLVWALYSVELRKVAHLIGARPLVGSSFLIGTAWFLVLAILFEGVPPPIPAQAWGWLALYVAVPTLASFVLFNAALQRAPASLANLMVGAELGFTALFAALLFGERLSWIQWAGLGLVLAAVTGYLWLAGTRRAA